jgi:hypothetical protein
MSITSFEETPLSRQKKNNPLEYTYQYTAIGETDSLIVEAFAYGATYPMIVCNGQTLSRTDVQLTPIGWGLFLVDVLYSKKNNEVGSFQFSFDTTGATVRIKAAKEHIAEFPRSGETATDHKGALNVRADLEVEGTEIISRMLKMTYTFRHPTGIVNAARARLLARATAHTNSASFDVFEAGELLFCGATGQDGTDTEAEIAYHFIAEGNESSLTIGDITGIVKKGHHHAWIDFKKTNDTDGNPAAIPRCVYIDRVYDEMDFASELGWSP